MINLLKILFSRFLCRGTPYWTVELEKLDHEKLLSHVTEMIASSNLTALGNSHVTIAWAPSIFEELKLLLLWGTSMKIDVTAICFDDKAMAAIVDPRGISFEAELRPKVYHITMALSPNTEGVYSNDMLESEPNKTPKRFAFTGTVTRNLFFHD